jgi:WD40-like Beta Propeller Repeat
MKSILIKSSFLFICLLNILISKSQTSKNVIFEQDCNDSIPSIFAHKVISTDYAEFGISISPDLSEIYFTRRGVMPNPRAGKIMSIKKNEGKWGIPEIASFSGIDNDMEPLITSDGNKIIFGSNRPLPGTNEPGQFLQWYVTRTGSGWSEPQILGEPFINRFVMYPTIANNGNLYFTGEDGIYVSYIKNNNYQSPIKLSDAINSLPRSAHPFISPDESYLIFDAQPRGSMKSDLFISHNKNGNWSKAIKLGGKINTAETQAIPFISYDGKYFFFVRKGDIYIIKTEFVGELKLVLNDK